MSKLQITTVLFFLILASQSVASGFEVTNNSNNIQETNNIITENSVQITYKRQTTPAQPAMPKYGGPELRITPEPPPPEYRIKYGGPEMPIYPVPTPTEVYMPGPPDNPIMIKYGGPEMPGDPQPAPTNIYMPDNPEQPLLTKYGGPEMYRMQTNPEDSPQ